MQIATYAHCPSQAWPPIDCLKQILLIIEYLMEIIKSLTTALTPHFQFSSSYSRDLSLTRQRSWTVQWNSCKSWNFIGKTPYVIAIMRPIWSNIWNCQHYCCRIKYISTSEGPITIPLGCKSQPLLVLLYYNITITVEHSRTLCCTHSSIIICVNKDRGKKYYHIINMLKSNRCVFKVRKHNGCVISCFKIIKRCFSKVSCIILRSLTAV